MISYSILEHEEVHEIVLENGKIKLTIIPEQGGRIVEFSMGGENVLFRNEDFKYRKGDVKAERNPDNWINFGGYKGWYAPQSKWGWPPPFDIDLSTFSYEISKSNEEIKVLLKSNTSSKEKLYFIREITMIDNNDFINISETIVNDGDIPIQLSVWANIQVQCPGITEIQLNSDSFYGGITFYQGFDLPSQNSYSISRERANTLKINCDNRESFKLGTMTDYSSIKYYCTAYKDKKNLFIIDFQYEGKKVYPHGSNVEIYVDKELRYSELEVLGREDIVKPGESKTLKMSWNLERI